MQSIDTPMRYRLSGIYSLTTRTKATTPTTTADLEWDEAIHIKDDNVYVPLRVPLIMSSPEESNGMHGNGGTARGGLAVYGAPSEVYRGFGTPNGLTSR